MGQTLHMGGETVRGSEAYVVEKKIGLPFPLDLDTAECTHADGALTVTLKKKAAKKIPVTVAVADNEHVKGDDAGEPNTKEGEASSSSEGVGAGQGGVSSTAVPPNDEC